MSRLPSALCARVALTGSVFALAIAAAGSGTAGADTVNCDRVAAPTGSDSAAGTVSDPYRSAQKLVDSIGAGQTGCLRAGTYHEDLYVSHGGNGDDSRMVISSYPGERAKIAGRIEVTQNADYLTVQQLDLDGSEAPGCNGGTCDVLPSPTVNGDHVTFQDNDVTNHHTGICFAYGNIGYGRPQDAVIQRNRIHDCGRLPSSNHDHGIYLAYADHAKILDNVIYDNADRGIQLYPDAQGTLIRGNIIDGNGEGIIFSGAGSTASSNTTVENNVVTNSVLRHDIESWYPDVVGHGNTVRNNCVWGGKEGTIANAWGYDIGSNLEADPKYVDRAHKDFTLAAGSPCADILAGGDAPTVPSGFRPGKQTGNPNGGKPVQGDNPGGNAGSLTVTVSNAILRRSRHHGGRWRLRVSGHVHGARHVHRGFIQARRGGSWQRIGARRLGPTFRVSVDPRLPSYYHARPTRIRIVIPGVAKSRPAPARVSSR